MEVWKDIEHFEGYQVSNQGRVRSFVNNRHGVGENSHILKGCCNQHGYPTVQLGRGKRQLVSRLVANAFIPNPENYPIVRHLDDNPMNNDVDNLAWGTQVDNMQDCVRRGRLVGDTSSAIRSRRKGVIAINKDDRRLLRFVSIQEAARELDVWPQHICNVIQGKISQTGGWIFKYAEEEEWV